MNSDNSSFPRQSDQDSKSFEEPNTIVEDPLARKAKSEVNLICDFQRFPEMQRPPGIVVVSLAPPGFTEKREFEAAEWHPRIPSDNEIKARAISQSTNYGIPSNKNHDPLAPLSPPLNTEEKVVKWSLGDQEERSNKALAFTIGRLTEQNEIDLVKAAAINDKNDKLSQKVEKTTIQIEDDNDKENKWKQNGHLRDILSSESTDEDDDEDYEDDDEDEDDEEDVFKKYEGGVHQQNHHEEPKEKSTYEEYRQKVADWVLSSRGRPLWESQSALPQTNTLRHSVAPIPTASAPYFSEMSRNSQPNQCLHRNPMASAQPPSTTESRTASVPREIASGPQADMQPKQPLTQHNLAALLEREQLAQSQLRQHQELQQHLLQYQLLQQQIQQHQQQQHQLPKLLQSLHQHSQNQLMFQLQMAQQPQQTQRFEHPQQYQQPQNQPSHGLHQHYHQNHHQNYPQYYQPPQQYVQYPQPLVQQPVQSLAGHHLNQVQRQQVHMQQPSLQRMYHTSPQQYWQAMLEKQASQQQSLSKEQPKECEEKSTTHTKDKNNGDLNLSPPTQDPIPPNVSQSNGATPLSESDKILQELREMREEIRSLKEIISKQAETNNQREVRRNEIHKENPMTTCPNLVPRPLPEYHRPIDLFNPYQMAQNGRMVESPMSGNSLVGRSGNQYEYVEMIRERLQRVCDRQHEKKNEDDQDNKEEKENKKNKEEDDEVEVDDEEEYEDKDDSDSSSDLSDESLDSSDLDTCSELSWSIE